MTNLTVSVTIINGQIRVTSLDIAEKFDKPHDYILKVIKRLLTNLPKNFIAVNFYANEYKDSIGRTLPMYQLTRDAFSLVAMGLTGKEALAWKVRYIEAFNVMEKELLKKAEAGKKRIEQRAAAREQAKLPSAISFPANRPEPGDRYYAYLEKVEAWRVAALNEREKLYREGIALLEADRLGTILFHACADYISRWLEHDVLSSISVFDKFLESRQAPIALAKFLNGAFESAKVHMI